MRTFLTLLGRELKSYFYSPIAYVVMVFFLIATGGTFLLAVKALSRFPAEITVVEVAFSHVLFWFPFIFVFPLITMRSYADEFRTGTFETLTTAPVQDWQVVISKFLGALGFYCFIYAPSFLYFALFKWVVGKDAALSSGAYLGAFLLVLMLGMFYTSIGCLASAMSSEQINAAVICFVGVFFAFVIGLVGFFFDLPEFYKDIASYISPFEHMRDYSRGLIDSRPAVFYLTATAFMLFLNYHVFQYRKWKS